MTGEAITMAQTPEERKKANIKAVKKSQEKTDAIMLRPPKEDGARIRSAASAAGKTVSAYILEAVYERMKKDGFIVQFANADKPE